MQYREESGSVLGHLRVTSAVEIPMEAGDLQHAEYWRHRAKETRKAAFRMQDATVKRLMLQVARVHDRMATLAAKRETTGSWPEGAMGEVRRLRASLIATVPAQDV